MYLHKAYMQRHSRRHAIPLVNRLQMIAEYKELRKDLLFFSELYV